MNRLLYYGCTQGTDVALLQNDLNVITRHTQQSSALAFLEVDGIFGAKSQARVMEFQRINYLTVDGVAGPDTQNKLDELFLSEPGLQTERLQGGIGNGDVAKTAPGKSFGKMPSGDTGVAKGNIGKNTGSWGKRPAVPGVRKTGWFGGSNQGTEVPGSGYKLS